MVSCHRTNKVKTHHFIGAARPSVRLSDDVSSTLPLLACVTESLCYFHSCRERITQSIAVICLIHRARAVSSALLLSILPRYAFNRVTVTPSENLVVGGGSGGAVLRPLLFCHCRSLYFILTFYFWLYTLSASQIYRSHKTRCIGLLVLCAFIPLNRRIEHRVHSFVQLYFGFYSRQCFCFDSRVFKMPFKYENRFALTRSNAPILPTFTPCTIYHAVLVFDRISFLCSLLSNFDYY